MRTYISPAMTYESPKLMELNGRTVVLEAKNAGTDAFNSCANGTGNYDTCVCGAGWFNSCYSGGTTAWGP